MPAYVVAQIEVTDPEKYEDYRKLAPAVIEKFGGRFLVRGGEMDTLEGEQPFPRMVVLEFPSLDTIRQFYASPEYQHAKAARDGAARMVFTALEGL